MLEVARDDSTAIPQQVVEKEKQQHFVMTDDSNNNAEEGGIRTIHNHEQDPTTLLQIDEAFQRIELETTALEKLQEFLFGDVLAKDLLDVEVESRGYGGGGVEEDDQWLNEEKKMNREKCFWFKFRQLLTSQEKVMESAFYMQRVKLLEAHNGLITRQFLRAERWLEYTFLLLAEVCEEEKQTRDEIMVEEQRSSCQFTIDHLRLSTLATQGIENTIIEVEGLEREVRYRVITFDEVSEREVLMEYEIQQFGAAKMKENRRREYERQGRSHIIDEQIRERYLILESEEPERIEIERSFSFACGTIFGQLQWRLINVETNERYGIERQEDREVVGFQQDYPDNDEEGQVEEEEEEWAMSLQSYYQQEIQPRLEEYLLLRRRQQQQEQEELLLQQNLVKDGDNDVVHDDLEQGGGSRKVQDSEDAEEDALTQTAKEVAKESHSIERAVRRMQISEQPAKEDEDEGEKIVVRHEESEEEKRDMKYVRLLTPQKQHDKKAARCPSPMEEVIAPQGHAMVAARAIRQQCQAVDDALGPEKQSNDNMPTSPSNKQLVEEEREVEEVVVVKKASSYEDDEIDAMWNTL